MKVAKEEEKEKEGKNSRGVNLGENNTIKSKLWGTEKMKYCTALGGMDVEHAPLPSCLLFSQLTLLFSSCARISSFAQSTPAVIFAATMQHEAQHKAVIFF